MYRSGNAVRTLAQLALRPHQQAVVARVKTIRFASTSSENLAKASLPSGGQSRKFNPYSAQRWNGVVYASVTLAALIGWTAAVVVTTPRKKPKHHSLPTTKDEAIETLSSIPATDSEASSIPEKASEAEDTQGDNSEDSSQQAAYNPETGEINWDCPCLGGMADGPCGEEFKAAFSCFVYSEEEPKGVDCVEKFKGMQDCFRQHPDVYGNEDAVEDEEDLFTEAELIERAEMLLEIPDEDFAKEMNKINGKDE